MQVFTNNQDQITKIKFDESDIIQAQYENTLDVANLIGTFYSNNPSCTYATNVEFTLPYTNMLYNVKHLGVVTSEIGSYMWSDNYVEDTKISNSLIKITNSTDRVCYKENNLYNFTMWDENIAQTWNNKKTFYFHDIFIASEMILPPCRVIFTIDTNNFVIADCNSFNDVCENIGYQYDIEYFGLYNGVWCHYQCPQNL